MAPIPNKENTSDSSTTESENYSVDAMMARLKKGNRQKRQSDKPQEGELITREDGTQVVKVRRRKRRSKQSPKKGISQTNPKLKWVILGTLVGTTVLLAAGSIFIIAKYNGRHFKATTESTISELSGATQTTLTQLRVTPVSANAQKTEITWDKHAFIKDASFSSIRANIKATSYFSSRWIGEDIIADKGTVRLQIPSSSAESIISDTTSPYEFGAYRCAKLQLLFGSDRGVPAINDLKVSLRQLDNGQHQIIFHDGTFKVKNWPIMSIESGIALLNSDSVNIDAILKSSQAHNGELTITGNILKDITTPATLDIKAKNYPIQELLGKDLGRLIKGALQSESGTFSYHYNKPAAEALSFILPFNSNEIQCEGLPLFRELNKLIGNTAYVSPIFYQCRGTILRTSEGISVNDLELINNDLMLIRGNISVSAKGRLSGKLSVGIPQTAFRDSAPAPFAGPVGGFHSIDISLSGSAKSPNDNLHQQLKEGRQKRQKLKSSPLSVPKENIQPQKNHSPPKEQDIDDLYQD